MLAVNAKTGLQEKKRWAAEEVLRAVPWLKRLNAKGSDVFLRPTAGPEVLVLGQLTQQNIELLRNRKLEPALTVEVSPGHFQAWIKLAKQQLSKEERQALETSLPAANLGGYGRLAGFTNQQTAPDLAGRHPYVLAREAGGALATGASQLLDAVRRGLEQQKLENERVKRAELEKSLQLRNRGRSR